jgi:hypothetical protein
LFFAFFSMALSMAAEHLAGRFVRVRGHEFDAARRCCGQYSIAQMFDFVKPGIEQFCLFPPVMLYSARSKEWFTPDQEREQVTEATTGSPAGQAEIAGTG